MTLARSAMGLLFSKTPYRSSFIHSAANDFSGSGVDEEANDQQGPEFSP